MIEVSKNYKTLTGNMTLDDHGMRLMQDYNKFIFKGAASCSRFCRNAP